MVLNSIEFFERQEVKDYEEMNGSMKNSIMMRKHVFQKIKTAKYSDLDDQSKMKQENYVQGFEETGSDMEKILDDHVIVEEIGANMLQKVKDFDGVNNRYIQQCLRPDDNIKEA